MKHSVLMTAVVILASLSATLPLQAREPSLHEKAVAILAANPDMAEQVLKQASNPTEELDYALFLHAMRPHTVTNKAKIAHLSDDVRAAIAAKGDVWGKDIIGDIMPYDGSDKSLIPLIQLASMSGVGQTESAFYAIPCGVLQKRPGLLDATAPLYGGNGDNFLPRSGCGVSRGTVIGYPEKLVSAYTALADRADGCIACNRGTIRFMLESQEALYQERMRLDPRYFPTNVGPNQAYPYQVWSYLSLSNRRLGRRIEGSYRQTRAALASYYRTMGLSRTEATMAASNALFSATLGANCGVYPLKTSLRTLVLDNASEATIVTFLKSHKYGDSTEDSVSICAGAEGKDPMAHIALVNPEIFQLLADRAKGLSEEERVAEDLQMDVNQANAFGKTPLMTAAQFGLTESADYLIAHGADVNAALPLPGTLQAIQRTALHYAAASGSLPMIRLLIAHGADIHAKDAVGQNTFNDGPKNTPGGLIPLDYFEGEGPVDAPRVLSNEDKAVILKALSD